MSALEFVVTFHSPFRVGTGMGRTGVDNTAHRLDAGALAEVAPASTVKGVMRTAAGELLQGSLVDEVFGGRGAQCGWSWSGITVPADAVRQRARTRIEISAETGTVTEDMLAVAEELVIAATGRFTIRRLGFVPVGPRAERRHQAVLRVAAGLLDGAGGTRRRGLGWISVVPAGAEPQAQARADLAELAAGGWL